MTSFQIVVLCLASWTTSSTAFAPRDTCCSGQRPPRTRSWSSSTSLAAALVPGDTLLVVGGTGGVGQLVTQKTRRVLNLRVASRNVERAEETLQAAADDAQGTIDVVPLDLVHSDADDGLGAAKLKAALDGVAGLFVSVGTTAFPTVKWWGGNTPQAVDADAVTRLVRAAAAVPTMKKIVLVTSVGVYRTEEMPFKILNLCGVLDAKRAGEDALKAAAGAADVDWVIVRPGRLIGGPFTNLDFARLLQVEGGADNGVDVAAGDALLGDCNRDACSQAIVQALLQDEAKNVEFSLVSNDKAPLKDEEWKQVFASLAT